MDISNRYGYDGNVRSTYSMIIADADKTPNPIAEMIRQHKYALEKHTAEGNKEIVICDDTGKPISMKDESLNDIYIANRPALKILFHAFSDIITI